MGRIKKHVLGIPVGKVGDSVCFSTWRGKACVRSLASSVKNPRTDKQMSYRFRFSLLGKLLSPLTAVLNAGFKDQGTYGANAITPLNAFMQYNINNDCFKGQGPDEWEIDFEKLKVAKGGLTGFASTKFEQQTLSTDNNVVFTWTSDEESTSEDDQVYCVLYNEALNLGRFTTVERSAGTATVLLKDSWIEAGNTQIYIFAFDGKKSSESEYLGYIS